MTDNNFNYDSFVRNPPNPVDIENLSLYDSLFSSNFLIPSPFNSFNISSFSINGLKMYSQNKIELLNNFISLKQISFGDIINTHLHPKQMHFLAKRLSNYTVFFSNLDTFQHVRYFGSVSFFIENSLASHVHTYTSHSLRLLSIDLYFKGNALSEVKKLGFHHAVCRDFNMHLNQFYPIFFNQPQIASKRIHRLFNFLLSNGYVDFTPVNFSDSLGTFHRADIISCIDYVWSCPLLKLFLLTSVIFDVCDTCFSDHNPVITYYDYSPLHSSIKLAHARQLKRHFRRIFSFNSVTPLQWDDFSTHIDKLCIISPTSFASWHINRMCEYLHANIIVGANAILPTRTVGNDNTPTLPKDLETLLQHYHFLNHLLTDPKNISDAVVDHFQNVVPIKSTPPSHISALPDRWCSEYSPLGTISPNIYNSLLFPPSLEEWLSTVSSMPNGKAPDSSMITYEMLKHLGPTTNSLLLILIFIRKSFVKLFYNRLSFILATHNVLTSGNFARLPGGTCRDPIITLESLIHDANHNNSSLWILSQDISKAFDSVNLTMLKFALERIRLPAFAVMFILSLFMKCSNQVFTAHGDTFSYWVCIGINQGERSSSLLLITTVNTSNLAINNLVFMDDSTLISSSKAGLKHMLSITEEFYTLNNTSANHQKYVLISNSLPLTTTTTISPINFTLKLSTLNRISSLSVTPISITSLFQFLGAWFNIKGSHDFVKKQIAGECNSFTATLCLARLSAKQVVYLYNNVFVPKLEYQMQVTHLSEKDCYTATRSICSLVKQKANFSRSLPNPILYLSQALGLINLFSHMV
ncbi:hypothetical protein RclHR1_08240015 [Rhizophagus clarus]|uniref:Reverse transcriptase domain-containing protein n=1 Tax=Rhizophagus clarus TaxID=94130 RepID=A0A2Z6SBD8_9GLOM|nr:hypothetical protein RclHR1_08240015 [Rhizophagus clarus]